MTKERIAPNRVEVSIENYRIIRKLYFQSNSLEKIHKKTKFTVRVLQRVRNENKLIEKRERYYRFLCYLSFSTETRLENICKKTGVRYTSLIKFRKRKCIRTRKKLHPKNKRMTDKLENKIINDYNNGLVSREIALKYGFKTGKTVLDVLEDKDIKRRESKKITFYNVEYFDKINSNEKAYILGLLLTDGYVLKNYDGIAIQLIIDDKYILEKIANELGKSATVIDIDCSVRRKKSKYNIKDAARMSCHSKEISMSLRKFGVVRNKTLILKCPIIYKKYLSHFFRGLIDGDGCIGKNKDGYLWVNLVSASKDFVEGVIELPSGFKFSLTERKPENEKHNLIYKMSVLGGQIERIRFLRWMYKNNDGWFLRRKYEKVQSFIN